jgi:hypothetical protein
MQMLWCGFHVCKLIYLPLLVKCFPFGNAPKKALDLCLWQHQRQSDASLRAKAQQNFPLLAVLVTMNLETSTTTGNEKPTSFIYVLNRLSWCIVTRLEYRDNESPMTKTLIKRTFSQLSDKFPSVLDGTHRQQKLKIQWSDTANRSRASFLNNETKSHSRSDCNLCSLSSD